ncbi:MAG TPA: radical SAM protein [Candidatus Saccharimonadales bacterium]|nr:radical SAM protein [Candidatus Saccharimonadales bacterium]
MASDFQLNHRQLYRLPWNLADNIISWLEPTKTCNIYCEGCYSANQPASHKSLEQIQSDLDVFERFRQTDAVSIAGGEPLTHPQIVEIVRMVAQRGLKPVVNTNGHALTPELTRDLKRAGLRGFTFHVDSMQKRPGWTGKTELELNTLRLRFAEMAAEVGGISCAFNATVYERNLRDVPEIVAWARRHADIVHVVVFINYRATMDQSFDHYVNGRKVDVQPLVYHKHSRQRSDISANEVVAEIRKRFPEFEPCAYLNGTEDPKAFKWLLTLPFGVRDEMLGCAGPKFMELSQVLHHLRHGRYLGYVTPQMHRNGRLLLLLAGLDRGLRRVLGRDLLATLRNPLRLFRPLHMQSVMIIQPVDMMADGRQSMCDGCPDMTVHEGQLVWSCRLEERLKFGTWMHTVPAARKPEVETPAPPAPRREEQPQPAEV